LWDDDIPHSLRFGCPQQLPERSEKDIIHKCLFDDPSSANTSFTSNIANINYDYDYDDDDDDDNDNDNDNDNDKVVDTIYSCASPVDVNTDDKNDRRCFFVVVLLRDSL